MAKQVKLAAERRSGTGRSTTRKLRAQGVVPAVIYGSKDKPENLQISKRDIDALLSHASGENILVELEVSADGKTSSRTALMQEIQHSPVSGAVVHVDFHAVSMNEVITAEVPVEPVGTATGVKNFGGLLEQSLRSLEVECLPANLPDRLEVDVTSLNIGDMIHVRDLMLPEGVKVKEQADLTVFSVLAPTVEEEPVAAAAEPAAAPEVIKEKKEEAPTETAPKK